MKIKRIISLLMIAVMCFGLSVFPVGAETDNVSGEAKLYALGILDKSTNDLSKPVTRLEMVKYATRLLGNGVAFAKGATPFADIAADSDDSGAVNLAIAKNIISPSAMFYPDRTVRYEEALKMLVTALEYSEYANANGAYPVGYITAAFDIGLLDGVEAGEGDGLTLKTVVTLLDNALDSYVCNPTLLVDENGGLKLIITDSSSKETVLNKRFNVSKYDAFITEYRQSEGTLKAEIISKDKNDVKAIYKAGDIAKLTVASKGTVGDIKFTYADIYVNDADEIIFAETDKNIEVLTGHIYEVNESHNRANQYPSYIYNIALEDSDDYIEFAENCKMYFGGKEANKNSAYPYVGAFCRAVIYKDEIIALEAWDLTEGGIIKSVGDDDITYIKGESPSTLLPDLTDYKDLVIYINGLKSELWALTDGIIFDWYASNDKETLLIVASSRAITDEFETISNRITLGGDLYPLSEKYKVYASVDGENYSESVDKMDLLGRTVTAYVDFAGYIRYLRPVLDDELNKEFYSFICGFDQKGLKTPEIEAYIIQDGLAVKKVYTITEKMMEKQGLLINKIENEIATIKAADSAAKNEALKKAEVIYKIRVNDRNEITSIRPATLFSEPVLNGYYASGKYGYAITDFTSMAVANTSNPRVYFDTADLCALYYTEEDGIVLKTVLWDQLKARSGSNLFLTPFATAGSSDVELMLIRGDVETIGHSRVEYVKTGLATDVSVGYDANKEKEVISVNVEGNQYVISKYKKEFANVTDAAYILYSTDNPFLAANEIRLTSVFNLSGSPDNWETVAAQQVGLHKDEIEKIDTKRVYFASGDVWYMTSTIPVYQIIETNGKVKFVPSERGNVPKGADAWYIYQNYEIRALFYR